MSKILIVDDEFSVRELISSSIKQFTDHQVEIAQDGFEAVKKVMVENYDLIITDIKMPKMNGVDAIKAVKIIKKDIPIIIMTGYASEAEQKEALAAGANELMTKPFSVKALMDKVEYYLKKSKNSADDENKKEEEAALTEKVILIGSSDGGPQDLISLLTKLEKKDLPPIVITQHIPKGFSEPVASALREETGLNVHTAKENDLLENGRIYVAQSPNHILLKEGKITYGQADSEQNFVPSISKTFVSFAKEFKEKCLMFVFRGLSAHIDSKEGLIYGKESNCKIYALEDHQSRMLDKFKRDDLIDEIVELDKIAEIINNF